MPGLFFITVIALLSPCDGFRLVSSQRVLPVGRPGGGLFQDESPAVPHLIQELFRTKRHLVPELVRVQPHLVHDMGRPEIQEISRFRVQAEAVNASQSNPPPSESEARPADAAPVDESMDVEDEMERMVHLASQPESYSPHREHLGGPAGAGDGSQEASGFYGTDAEDRDRAEDGGEERERRDEGTDDGDASEMDRLTPDLDALIGYSPSFQPFSSVQPDLSSPVGAHDSGPQEHRGPQILEISPTEREPWEAEGEEDAQSSGYGVVRSSVATATSLTSPAPSASSSRPSTVAAGGDAAGTVTPETDTGTDFGLLGGFTKDETEPKEHEERVDVFGQNPTVPEVGVVPSKEPLQPSVEELDEQEHEEHGLGPKDKGTEVEEEMRERTEREGTGIRPIIPLTTDQSQTVSSTDPSWNLHEKTTPLHARRSEVGPGNAVTEEMKEAQQVVCIDWKELVGRGYVILNMTQNLKCEEFRADRGLQLLRIMEQVFARRMNSPEGSWVLYLSKPTHQQHQLLMNVASERGVIATNDVLDMLGEIRKSLNKVGIQNYSATGRCRSQPAQTRSDYGKLFVVLVIIGSICMVIITSGIIYICWQRRLPTTKTMFRAEELHFVENGCHDNPMLDVTNDAQPEMQEKKPSTNGLAGAGERGKEEDNSRWQGFVNQGATEEEEEEEEQDTHL